MLSCIDVISFLFGKILFQPAEDDSIAQNIKQTTDTKKKKDSWWLSLRQTRTTYDHLINCRKPISINY